MMDTRMQVSHYINKPIGKDNGLTFMKRLYHSLVTTLKQHK